MRPISWKLPKQHFSFCCPLQVLRVSLLLLFTILAATQSIANAADKPRGGEIREVFIPMPDGVQLAVDLYVPANLESDEKLPIIIEYNPYRKDEGRGSRFGLYQYFVENDYIVARIDIRGTGRSTGVVVQHEYTDQEQEDAEVAIDWLSKRPYSNGNIGMFGISWSGFNSIHLAMRNPPALKAIIAVDSADDLYEDDVHYMDGIMHVDAWEIDMDIANAQPASPDFIIDDAYYRDRFNTDPWMVQYKRQQRDGPFWNRASLNEDYASIKVPTYVIGGWYDGYRDSVPRMLENLKAPVKGMIGPWQHTFPNWGYPGKGIEWRAEAVRWFDHWLRDADNGIMDEPKFSVFVRNWHRPGTDAPEITGTWRYEDGWPIKRAKSEVLYPSAAHTLSNKPEKPQEHKLKYKPTTGIVAGGPVMWFGDLAWDQQPADGQSMVYDSGTLEEDLEILGMPVANLQVSADAPHANWIVRLSDVAPDGQVSLVSAAGLNGTHRNSAENPEDLVPGQIYPLKIDMHFTSWVFPKGHRIRLAVNNALWPMLWPSPYPMTTSLHLGKGTKLTLPVIPYEKRPAPHYPEPVEYADYPGYGEGESETPSGYAEINTVERNYLTQTVKVHARDAGYSDYPWGRVHYLASIYHTTNDKDPAHTAVDAEYKYTWDLKDNRELVFQGLFNFHSDVDNFYYEFTRKLFENGTLVKERTWEESIPRDYQ